METHSKGLKCHRVWSFVRLLFVAISLLMSMGLPAKLHACQDEYLMLAADGMEIRDRSAIAEGNLGAGNLILRAGASAEGSATVSGDVFLTDNAFLHGDLMHGGALTLANGAGVGSRIIHAPIHNPCIPALDGPITSGAERIFLGHDERRRLLPGTYEELYLSDRAVVELESGVYSFSQVFLGHDTRVQTISGPVQIAAQGSIFANDRVKIGNAEGPHSMELYSNKDITVGFDGIVSALLRAPAGMVQLADRTLLNGKIWAKGIQLHQDCRVGFGCSVSGPPVVSESPQSQTVQSGASLTFSVVAGNPCQMSYQWFKDGQEIPGANANRLNLTLVTAVDAGFYHCRLSNPDGLVYSAKARLSLSRPGSQTLLLTGTVQPNNAVLASDLHEVDMIVKLLPDETGGVPVYEESFSGSDGMGVALADGLFQIRLGEGRTTHDLQAAVAGNPDLWVEFQLGLKGQYETLSPRSRLSAMPYAFSGAPPYLKGDGNPQERGIQAPVGTLYLDLDGGSTWIRTFSEWKPVSQL